MVKISKGKDRLPGVICVVRTPLKKITGATRYITSFATDSFFIPKYLPAIKPNNIYA